MVIKNDCYIFILIFKRISRRYEEQKVTCIWSLSLFSLGTGLKKALTASFFERILSSTQKRKVLCQFFNLYLYIFFIVFFQYYPFFSCKM
ncbi:hypothetical protein COL60_12830 [Bacillus pseudomycoides]|nr:hypothetical protein COL60_12830 [Bacillus pseudomycoides]